MQRQLVNTRILLLTLFLLSMHNMFSQDQTLQKTNNHTVKKGRLYGDFAISPLTLSIGVDKNSLNQNVTYYTTNNIASLNLEYFVLDRFSVFGFAALQHKYGNENIDTSRIGVEISYLSKYNYQFGFGMAYYPRFLGFLNSKKSPIGYEAGILCNFNRSYTRGGFVNSTNVYSHNNGSLNLGYVMHFYLKDSNGLPTSRFRLQLVRSFPVYYIKSLHSVKIASQYSIFRFEENMLTTIGFKYLLNNKNETLGVRTRQSVLDDYYSKNSIHISASARTKSEYYLLNNESIFNLIFNLEGEYFLKKRLSINAGYIGSRPLSNSEINPLYNENKFNCFFSFYPKIIGGVNKISFSTSLGLSYLNVKSWLRSDLTDLDNNFGFNTLQLIGAYSVNYKPLKIFKRENNHFSIQFRTMGAIKTFNSLTKFREGDKPFEVFGSGLSRGMLVRLVYKL